MHLVVDGYGGDRDKLMDVDLVYRFLDEYPDALEMTKMIEPQVYTYRGKIDEDWGVSGFVLIAESHISVHTFPDRGYVNIDVFSCRDFDAAASLRVIEEIFGLSESKVLTLDRGLDHSTPRAAYNGMVRERVNIAGVQALPDG